MDSNKNVDGGPVKLSARDIESNIIKKLKVESGDIVIIKVADRRLVRKANELLNKVLLSTKKLVIGLTLPYDYDIQALSRQFSIEHIEAELKQQLEAAKEEIALLRLQIRKLIEGKKHRETEIKNEEELVARTKVFWTKSNQDIESLSDVEIKALFNRSCGFHACRYHTNRVYDNYCRMHGQLFRELEKRTKPKSTST